MKLLFPFIQLPLSYDAAALAAEIEAIDDALWRPHPQGFAGNSMLPLVAVDGDPANEEFAGRMQPTPHLEQCPYVMQVLASFGATVGRTRLMRLMGQAEVTRHVDQGYYWAERVRVHVPIVTQPSVRFECGDAAINMAEGECWIFDTWRQHRVLNDSERSRVHLVCDTVGGVRFWDLVGRGRPVPSPQPRAPWQSMRLEPSSEPVAFACESVNVPDVMSPWELSTHLGFLLAEMVPNPRSRDIEQQFGRLLRGWKGLWAQYGTENAGRALFRGLFDAFLVAMSDFAQGVALRNQVPLLPALQVMLGRVVVRTDSDSGAGAQHAMGDNA